MTRMRHPAGTGAAAAPDAATLELLAASATDMITVSDADGAFSYISPAARDVLGYAPAELLVPGAFRAAVVTEELPRLDATRQRLLDGQTQREAQPFWFRHADGSPRLIEVTGRVVTHPDGRMLLLGSWRDITERHRTETELAQTARTARALAENATDVLVIAAADGTITYVSPSAREQLGYDPQTLLGLGPLREIVHPEDLPRLISTRARQAAPDGPERIVEELRVRHADGTYRCMEIASRRVSNPDDGAVEMQSSWRDITARKDAEQELELALERLTSLADSASDVELIVDPDGTVTYASPSTREVLGYDPAKLLGSGAFANLHPDDTARLNERRRSLVEHEIGVGGGQYRIRHADGHYLWMEARTRRVTRPDGKVELRGTWRDITERKHVEELLRETNQELSQFAAAVSHDLHEPLRVISMCAELIGRGADTLDDQGRELLAAVTSSATRMSELIDGLLRLARVGGHTIRREPVDLADVFAAAEQSLRVALDEQHASVRVAPLGRVWGDRGLLIALAQNLLANAVKFRGADTPVVEVRAGLDGDWWAVTVADNGIGIAPADTARIFQVFTRVGDPDAYAGTGVGLALCERIVHRHGGRIGVASAPGRGAAFTFTVPAVEHPRAPAVDPDPDDADADAFAGG